jgi:hypothetical protein
MSAVYVWHDEQVITLPALDGEDFYDDGKHHQLTHKFMVDTHETNPSNRYGYMSNEDGYFAWESIPKDMFPKEFLTHLLLLGVQ